MRVFDTGCRPLSPFVLHYSPDSCTLAATAPTELLRTRHVWQWGLADDAEQRSEREFPFHSFPVMLTFDGVASGIKANLPPFRFPTKAGCTAAGFRRYCKALSAPVYASLLRYGGFRTKADRRAFLFVVLVRDASSPQRRRTIEWITESHLVGSLGLDANGGRVAANIGYAILVWDTTTGEKLGEVRPKRQQPGEFAFSADGRYLGVLFQDSVALYDTASWTVAKTYSWKVGKLRCLAFSPDGATAAVGSDKGKVVVFDLE